MPYQQKKQNGCILFGFRRVLIRVRNLMPRANSLTGFTLIEIIIALSIFTAALMITGGIIAAATSAQRKVTEFRRVQDNVRFALEYLSREIRTGKNMTTTCGNGVWCSNITLCNDRGEIIRYSVASSVLVRFHVGNCTGSADSGNINLTSDEIRVNSVSFNLIGGVVGPADGQPHVTVVFRGASVPGLASVQTDMNFQTTITQRLRDY